MTTEEVVRVKTDDILCEESKQQKLSISDLAVSSHYRLPTLSQQPLNRTAGYQNGISTSLSVVHQHILSRIWPSARLTLSPPFPNNLFLPRGRLSVPWRPTGLRGASWTSTRCGVYFFRVSCFSSTRCTGERHGGIPFLYADFREGN